METGLMETRSLAFALRHISLRTASLRICRHKDIFVTFANVHYSWSIKKLKLRPRHKPARL